MTYFSFDIVGFDLDGTLLDTSGDLAAAVNHALITAGRPELSVEQVKPMIGGGARHMLKQGLTATGGYDEAMLDTLHAKLLAYYEANICVLTKPYPGVIEAVDALAANGVTLGIVTNKIERFARTVLDQLGLTDRFACILGGDTLAESKPSPMPIHEMVRLCRESGSGSGRAAFVGDSIFDIQAGQAAGLPTIACSFGFLMQPVEELGADAVIDGYAELLPTLERLGA
ncbi:phosphoglycolate phosphatase [Sphingomonas sp. PP-F2F-G114-C0414]|uniref:HAD family hydrolase n=1 Tax=Sphingomonas sp. PP-F2F-G114-C0414 TaxID=2135662 RepID=UPI000EF8A229|nr:HAD family hydrolase [Sphingomonas sp. PP-F2F-G114-C0414]RMB37067.1 phosphoglycolate phosphatase [Sphingomonas sp. PP-F2F-G114-C0414]